MADDRIVTLPPDLVRSDQVFAAAPPIWSRPESVFKPIWESGITGKGVVVSINDTGVTRQHEAIDRSRIKVDKNYTSDSNGDDGNGHGSHVLGTAGTEMFGVAPECSLHVRKVLGNNGSGSTTGINRALVDAAKDGADFVNESLGSRPGTERPEDDEATRQAYEAGLSLRICAAGNAGYNGADTIGPPGSLRYVWTVGSYDEAGRISGFSSGGRTIECAAPGSNIVSISFRGGSTIMSGTSMAAPFWTGLMALVLHQIRRIGMPEPRGWQKWFDFFVKNNLLEDAGEPGFDPRFGYGKPNIQRIIAWLGGPKWL